MAELTADVTSGDAPKADITATPTFGLIPLDVDLDASGSSDPDGSLVNFEWDFNEDGVYDGYGTSSTVSHTNAGGGTFLGKVRVTDNGGAQDSATVLINVRAGTWVPQTVDSIGEVGTYTSMAVVNGNPAINFWDSTNSDLKFVRLYLWGKSREGNSGDGNRC